MSIYFIIYLYLIHYMSINKDKTFRMSYQSKKTSSASNDLFIHSVLYGDTGFYGGSSNFTNKTSQNVYCSSSNYNIKSNNVSNRFGISEVCKRNQNGFSGGLGPACP
jgi:hypothetical protein